MAIGVAGPNGVSARKTVTLGTKLEKGFATALYRLMVAKIALLMVQEIPTLECAITKVAQVCYYVNKWRSITSKA